MLPPPRGNWLGSVPSSFLPSIPAAATTAGTAAAAAATAVSIAVFMYYTAVPAAATAAAVTATAGSSGRKEAGTNPWSKILPPPREKWQSK